MSNGEWRMVNVSRSRFPHGGFCFTFHIPHFTFDISILGSEP